MSEIEKEKVGYVETVQVDCPVLGKPRKKVKVYCGTSKTQQQFKDKCDINKIVKKFAQTGLLPQKQGAQYLDVSNVGDYTESLATVKAAEDAMYQLPSEIRKKVKNDPVKALAYIQDEKNKDELIKYGLLEEPYVPDDSPIEVTITNQPAES